MSDLLDFCKEVLLPIGVMCAVGAVVLTSLIVGWDYLDCRGFQKGTGMETRWWWGCYAKVENQWVPKEYAFGKAHELRLKDKR